MDDLAESVFISKNTLNKYIKTIKEIIGKYDLEYITKLNAGIKIIGSEDSKRKCIFDNVLYTDFDHYITCLLYTSNLREALLLMYNYL